MTQKTNPFLHLMKPKAEVATPKTEEKNISESQNKGLTWTPKPAKVISTEVEKKVQNPLLIPQEQRLLGGPAPTMSVNEFGTAMLEIVERRDSGMVANDMRELGSINTESMEPQVERQTNLNVEAARLRKKLQLESAGDVRALCDALDARLTAIGGASLEGPALSDVRNYVQSLMVTLKTRPEFDEVIIDNDVRNVMKFIRATRQEALAVRGVKVVKKASREVKSEKATKQKNLLQGVFNNLMGTPDFSKLGGK